MLGQVVEGHPSPASIDWASVPPPFTPGDAVFFPIGPPWAEGVNCDAPEQAWRGSMQIYTLS